MMRLRLYRLLMGTLGIAMLLFGLALVASFVAYQRPHTVPAIPTGPVGHYFVAFTGCALMGWAGGLIGAARAPLTSRSVGTMTAVVFALMAGVRMMAWVVGDYWAWLGDLPRTEATILVLLAIALVWLRPTVAETCPPTDATDAAEPAGGDASPASPEGGAA